MKNRRDDLPNSISLKIDYLDITKAFYSTIRYVNNENDNPLITNSHFQCKRGL